MEISEAGNKGEKKELKNKWLNEKFKPKYSYNNTKYTQNRASFPRQR